MNAKNERGYVFILFGASLFALVSFFALVVDLGHIFVSKSQLQNVADSAALAAVVDIPSGTAIAEQSAIQFGQTHWVAGNGILIESQDVQFGVYDGLTKTFTAGANPINAVNVIPKRTGGSASGALPLFFADLFGINTTNVQASAIAYLDQHIVGVTGKNRLIPYSIDEDIVDQDGDGVFDVGATIDVFPGATYVPGNFGFLDLDGGSNSNLDTKEWIEDGYYTDFTIPPNGSVIVSGDTGISGNSLLNSFLQIAGEVVFFPIHTTVVNPGSNAQFTVVSFAAGRVTDVQLSGNPEDRHINVEIIYYASSVLVTDPNAPVNPTLAKPRLVA
jgi:hypothetical protein